MGEFEEMGISSSFFKEKSHSPPFLNPVLTSADGWGVVIAKTKNSWDAFIINIDTSFASVVLEARSPLPPVIDKVQISAFLWNSLFHSFRQSGLLLWRK